MKQELVQLHRARSQDVIYRLNVSPNQFCLMQLLALRKTTAKLFDTFLFDWRLLNLNKKHKTTTSVSCSVGTTVCFCFPSGIYARPSSYPPRKSQRRVWVCMKTTTQENLRIPQRHSRPAASTLRGRDVWCNWLLLMVVEFLRLCCCLTYSLLMSNFIF